MIIIIIIIIKILFNYLTTFLLIVQSQTVTIKIKGREHTYYHTSELDDHSMNESPVSPPDAKLQLSWMYLLLKFLISNNGSFALLF